MGAIPMTFERFRCGTLELTKGVGADKGCECVGYQCCDKHGTEHSNITMNELVQAVKATGSIGCWSFVPKDPKSKKNCRKKGHMDFDFGQFWMKGRIATGQANIKAYNRQLSTLISVGKAKPSLIVSHELSLNEAPDAYKHYDAEKDGQNNP
jgi:threonine dehydrogenase-like Zn-dependent dehydrogenase